MDGFARQLLEVAAREMKLELEFRLVHGDAVASLLAREIDVICPISIHEAYLERMAFTMPIFIADGAVFVRSGETPPRTTEELRTRRVSVAGAGIAHRFCLENEIPVRVGPALIEALRAATLAELAGYIDDPRLDPGLERYIVTPRLGDDAGIIGAVLILGYSLLTGKDPRMLLQLLSQV